MNKLIASVASVAAAGALIVGSALPASAATKTRSDQRGDASAYLDITKVKYNYTKWGVTAKAHVRHLKNAGQFTFAVGNSSKSLRYGMVATRHGGTTTKQFYRFNNGTVTKASCAAHSVWSTRYSAVKLSFPRRCFTPLVGHHILLKIASSKPGFTTVDGAPTVTY